MYQVRILIRSTGLLDVRILFCLHLGPKIDAMVLSNVEFALISKKFLPVLELSQPDEHLRNIVQLEYFCKQLSAGVIRPTQTGT